VITTADRFPKQTQDVDLHVVEAFHEIMPLSLDSHANAVQTCQALEDPADGGRRGGVGDVVRPGLLVLGHWLAPSVRCHRLDQEGERHHHHEPLDTAGLFDKPRRDKKPRICAKPAAPFPRGLACVGRDDRRILPLAGAASGAHHTTGVALLWVLHGCVRRPDVGRDVPVDGLDRQARCRAALTRVACMVAAVGGVELMIRPARGPCRQRLVGRFRRREACGWEVQELWVDGRTFAWPSMVERGRGALIGRLGRHPQPPRGHPVLAQLQPLLAGGVLQTRPTVAREGWRDHRCDRAHGVGKAGATAEGAEVGGMGCVVQRRVGAAIAGLGGLLKGDQPRLGPRLDHLAV